MNILIKLTCLIGLVIAPILGGHTEEGLTQVEDEVNVEVTMNSDELAEATITYTVPENGEEITKSETFKGSEAEVKAKLEAFETEHTNNGAEVKKVINEVNITKS